MLLKRVSQGVYQLPKDNRLIWLIQATFKGSSWFVGVEGHERDGTPVTRFRHVSMPARVQKDFLYVSILGWIATVPGATEIEFVRRTASEGHQFADLDEKLAAQFAERETPDCYGAYPNPEA